MSKKQSPTYQEPCALKAMNLHEPSEFENLIRQRKSCGWNYSPDIIREWRDQMDSGEKSLFWITLPSRENAEAGHISLDSLENSPDLEVRNSDKSILTIKTFFILPKYQSLGLGRLCMDILEDWAQKEPYGSTNCKAVVVDTLNKKYFEDPKWQNELRRLFPSRDQEYRLPVQRWYERRGYVQWKEEPKYQETGENGEDILLLASFLRKDLK